MNPDTANALLLVQQALAQLYQYQQQQQQAHVLQQSADLLSLVSLARAQEQQDHASAIVTFLQQSATARNSPPSTSTALQNHQKAKSISKTAPRRQLSRHLNEREELLAFVKILFRFLKTDQDESRLHQAKAIVSECTRRNRSGDADFVHLKRAVESRLRRTVGELYWVRAKEYLNSYIQRRGSTRPPASTIITAV